MAAPDHSGAGAGVTDGRSSMKRACVLLLAVTLFGCGGEPRMDATTDATTKESIRRMTAGLPLEKKQEFMRSVMTLSLWPAARRGEGRESPGTAETMKPLHGMTVGEVNAKAAAVRVGKR